MELHICKNYDQLSEHVADWMTAYISKILSQQERFTIALTGGSTPKKLYDLLASEGYKNKIDWSRANVFIGDERFVPFDDERNNSKMIQTTLLDHVAVIPEHVHFMQTESMSPETAANAYEEILNHYFIHEAISGQQSAVGSQRTTFDLVLLGLGDDAHTLSLFPGQTEAIHEEIRWCKYLWLQKQNMHRITLTPPIVNAAKAVAFLVSGNSKANALKSVLHKEFNPDKYPSQIIKPSNGELHWFVDDAAMTN